MVNLVHQHETGDRMNVEPLNQDMIPAVIGVMRLGEPFIKARTYSDYWLYAHLFSLTCPVVVENGALIGTVIAFRSQNTPEDVYLQDVMVHPGHRRQGVARTLINSVALQARAWGCDRLYLTSEPDNTTAHASWTKMGFTNIPGDRTIGDISVITDYKGPEKTRAVYERRIG